MSMSAEDKGKFIGMLGISLCLLAAASGWIFMRFGVSWSIADLPESEHLYWIIPAYIVAEVAVIPIGAKLADLWGCKRSLLIGPLLFIIGSMLATVSFNVEMLVVFRVIEGLGGGFILGYAFTAVGKYYEPTKRNVPHELMTGVFAVGSLLGSAVGYFFTDNFGWRSGFIILSLLVLLGVFLAWKYLPEHEGTGKPIDKVNLLIVMALFGVAAYYTQAVNSQYHLISVPSLIVVAIIVALLVLLMVHSRKTSDPIIPVHISAFEKKLIVLMFLFSMCGLGLIQYFFKLYLIYYEFDIYHASFYFILLILGAAGPSVIGCRKVMTMGVKPWVTIGAVIVTIALVMTHFIASQGTLQFGLSLFVFGFGLGMIVTEIIISLQGITPRRDMGQHTGNLMAVRMIGILIGNAVVGTYINEVIHDNRASDIINYSTTDNLVVEIGRHLSNSIQNASDALCDGFLTTVFIMAVVTLVLAVIAYTLRDYDLKNRSE